MLWEQKEEQQGYGGTPGEKRVQESQDNPGRKGRVAIKKG